MLSLEKICCHLKRECDNFKIYTIIPKAFTKITEQRVMTNKLSYQEIKWNHKRLSVCKRRQKKKKGGTKCILDKEKSNMSMI